MLRSTLVNEQGPDAYKILLYFPLGDGLNSLKIVSEVIKKHYLGFLDFHSTEKTALVRVIKLPSQNVLTCDLPRLAISGITSRQHSLYVASACCRTIPTLDKQLAFVYTGTCAKVVSHLHQPCGCCA